MALVTTKVNSLLIYTFSNLKKRIKLGYTRNKREETNKANLVKEEANKLKAGTLAG